MRKETDARGANPRPYVVQRTVHSEFLDKHKTERNPLPGKPKMIYHRKIAK